MQHTLEIQDDKIDVSLARLLRAIEPEALSQCWALLELEGIADPPILGKDLAEVQRATESALNGLPLSWSEVLEVAERMQDIWNITLVGGGAGSLPRRDEPNLHNKDLYVVERLDSSIWQLSVPSQEILERVRSRLGGTF